MKLFEELNISTLLVTLFLVASGCSTQLEEPELNNNFAGGTDFTKTEDMQLSIVGIYESFHDMGWEEPLLIGVRGDDVNHGGVGDAQGGFTDTDLFSYDEGYWMYNSVWEKAYKDIIAAHTGMELIARYQEFADDTGIALGNQYIAEAKVIRAMAMFNLSQLYGGIFILESSDTNVLSELTTVPSKSEVMQHLSDQMDEAIPNLLDMRPNERTDLPGGVTKYTALAIKALASQELKNYQAVADATSQIINSGKFDLFPDFYELFKTPGKLSNESIFDLQYSDFNVGEGDRERHLYAPFGPQGWTPSVVGAGSGWGFYEPSLKFIKFMIDRGETVRLETSVLFTDRGIDEIKKDPNYATLPGWISNTTRDGDRINDYSRALFASGKHYLPSNQLIAGRTDYGSNKNHIIIRYAEILLMHAEALLQGASGTALTATQAINLVRNRSGLTPLTGVTLDEIMDEKFAEFGMEWGKRYSDMVRLERYNELSYDGRTFSENKRFLPYPQAQVDQFPILDSN